MGAVEVNVESDLEFSQPDVGCGGRYVPLSGQRGCTRRHDG